MSDALLDEVFVLTVGSAHLNQMDLSPELWFMGEHEVHVCARSLADVVVWHEKYPCDKRVRSSDSTAALCFLSSLGVDYARAALEYVCDSCAGDDALVGRVFDMIVVYCRVVP